MGRMNVHRSLLHQERWATDRQIESLRKLAGVVSGPELPRAIGKIAHTVQARGAWLHRVSGGRYGRPDELWPKEWTFDELERAAEETAAHWEEWFASAIDEELDRVVEYASYEGKEFRNTVEDILLHVWSHGFYHRGQVGALINGMGGTPPAIDYIVRVREDDA